MGEINMKVATLSNDVPVDAEHVKVLRASIGERGQLASILVRKGTSEIIDGFHRVAALRADGVEWVAARAIECDDEQFRNARIISAAMHKGVSFARVTLWVREIFADTNWESRITAEHAFRLSGKVPGRLGSDAFKKALRSGLSSAEVFELVKWSREKAVIWGLTPEQIANMLEIADLASPYLTAYVRPRKHNREEVLTRPMLAAIVRAVPDHAVQEAVAKKAMAERLNEKETRELVLEVAAAKDEPAVLGTVLSTSWIQVQRDRIASRALSVPLTEDETKRKAAETRVWWAISMINGAAKALEELEPIFDEKLQAGVVSAITGLLAAIASYRGYEPYEPGESMTAGEMLAVENHRQARLLGLAMGENERLTAQVSRLQGLLGLGQEMYKEDAS